MKRTQIFDSRKLFGIAQFLSVLIILFMCGLGVTALVIGRNARAETKQSGPDYIRDELKIWNGQPLPTADRFLTENAANCVSTVRYVVPPAQEIGSQSVAILLQMTDGTVRTENATLSIEDTILYWELGTEATPASLAGEELEGAVFSQPLSGFHEPGTYSISINTDTESLPFTLVVQDTTPPAVRVKSPLQFMIHQQVKETDVIDLCEDASQVTLKFTTPPDTSSLGDKHTQLTATDAAGNAVTCDLDYTVSGDGDAPVISGTTDMKTISGVPVLYLRGVTAEDAYDGAVEVDVAEPEDFDLKKAGDYTITYTATDAAGNVATEKATLTVLESLDDVESLSEEDTLRIGDAIVQKIEEEHPDDTEKELARRLYVYVQAHMFYKDNKDVLDWHYGAVIAVARGFGDCRNYYAFARLLLTCAGFENMMVEHTPSSATASKHFWNLVKIDGSWYHFDTTPRVGRSDFFMMTDAELDAYSARNGNCFARDKSLYPATP